MMTIGKAVAIFERIGSFKLQDDTTDQEKIEAIETVLSMETFNGITKTNMVRVMIWMLMKITGKEDDG